MGSQVYRICLGSAIGCTVLLARNRPDFLLWRSYMLTALAIDLTLLFLYLCWSVLVYPFLFSPLRHLPQPSGSSWFNGQFARIHALPSGLPHREWINNVPNDGIIYYRSILNIPRIFVTSPEAHREVLSQKSYEYVKPSAIMQSLIRLLGRGLLVSDGDEHRIQRKNLMPAFAFRHVKDLYPAFWDKTRDLVVTLDKQPKTPAIAVDAAVWASRATLDIIGIAGIGSSFNAIEDPSGELVSTYSRIFASNGAQRILGLLGFFVPFWLLVKIPIQRNIEINLASRKIKDYCRRLVEGKRRNFADGKQSGVDILSVAIESGGFTDDDLVNQMMTFLAAGHETTSTALTWTLLFLCQHPEVQERLRKELRAASLPNIRDPNSTMTPDILDHIPYLNAVCNESLRFSPPVPMTMRASKEDNTICGHFIPAGTSIVLAPMAVHFDKKLWGDDAEVFNPDRWMGPGAANTGGSKSNYAFLSFLHGPRSCIGQAFAKAEFATLLAGIVSAYDISLQDKDRKVDIVGGVTQRVKGGLPVFLTPIDA